MVKKLITIYLLPLFLLIGSSFFFVNSDDYYTTRSNIYFWDLGHILFFAGVSWQFMQLPILKSRSVGFSFVSVLIITSLLGIMIELVQSQLGRNADIDDVVRNVIGALLGLSVAGAVRAVLSKAQQYSLIILFALLIPWQTMPFIEALYDERKAQQDFPVLATFESSAELSRWTSTAKIAIADMPDDIAIDDSRVLQVTPNDEKYIGAYLTYFPANWVGYDFLEFDVFNPLSETLTITVRIHDGLHVANGQQYGDRYNQQFVLLPNWNKVRVDLKRVKQAPEGREMDMTNIFSAGLFTTQRMTEPFYIDNVQLYR